MPRSKTSPPPELAQGPDVADGAPAPSPARLAELVERSADVKRRLVEFAQGPRYARRLDALLYDAADDGGGITEADAVGIVDRFALQYRPAGGGTVLEQFAARHGAELAEDERAMLLGWRTVVEGVFEVRGHDGDTVLLHNLLDDLLYRTRSNAGPRALSGLRRGGFAAARVVPVHPASQEWLVTGLLSGYRPSDGPWLARTLLQEIHTSPDLVLRNPRLAERSWRLQHENRAAFVERFGTDLLVLPPREAARELGAFHRGLQDEALKALPAPRRPRERKRGPDLSDEAFLPEELLAAETVGVHFDEVEGLGCYAEFGAVRELFADAAPTPDRERLALLRTYLNDDSVGPAAVRRLAADHPDTRDAVFRALLRKPAFTWDADGERLLRRRKKRHFAREPYPTVLAVPDRLSELARSGR